MSDQIFVKISGILPDVCPDIRLIIRLCRIFGLFDIGNDYFFFYLQILQARVPSRGYRRGRSSRLSEQVNNISIFRVVIILDVSSLSDKHLRTEMVNSNR